MKSVPTLAILVSTVAAAYSQQVPPIDYDTAYLERKAVAVRIDQEITMDGVLDEPAWDLAEPAGNFVQWQPSPGAPSGEPTEVYLLYDDDNLYVGFVNFDSQPERMLVNDLREDFQPMGTDSIGIVIDSLDDNRSGFLFGTNPAGARRDAQISNDSSFNNDWDGVWDVRVNRNEQGWSAEFVIPFKTLRFSNAPTQEWGLNLNRRVLRLNEESLWSPLPVRYRISRVSMAGTLQGLENIRQGRNLKVTPYVTAAFSETRTDPAADVGVSRYVWDDDYDGGVDLKYGLRPSLTLDGTYNTDFAQVEADQQQVNLTRFSLFFPEKRDFFLENAGTFSFGSNSGGGGGGRDLIPFFSRRIGLNRRGTPIPIAGGARVSGQIGRYDVGVLAMKTQALDPADDPDLDPLDQTPSDNFFVGRIKRNILNNSWIGAIVTRRDSDQEQDHNTVFGADARLQFFNRLNLDSYILLSDTPDRDGDDQARKFEIGWNDDELQATAGYLTIQPDFNPEVGFVRRPDMTRYDGEFTFAPLIESHEAIRNLRFETGLSYIRGASSGDIETREHRITTGIQFQDNSSLTFTTRDTLERLVTPDRIQGVEIPAGDYRFREYSFSASGGQSWAINPSGSISSGDFWNGERTSLSGGLALKLDYRWSLDLDYTHNRLTLTDERFTTDLLGARFIYGFSPNAFFNAYIQYNTTSNRVSSNIRFNWTHSPLSDLYIVYNDTRDTDRGELADRAIIIKFTNLFNF